MLGKFEVVFMTSTVQLNHFSAITYQHILIHLYIVDYRIISTILLILFYSEVNVLHSFIKIGLRTRLMMPGLQAYTYIYNCMQ